MFENHLSQYAAMQKSFHRHKSMPQDLLDSLRNFSHWEKKGKKARDRRNFYFISLRSPPLMAVLSRIICTFCAAGGHVGEGSVRGSRRVKINVPVGAEAASPVIHALTFRAVKHR
jgi:hypothetical protein